jgi:hypothetical protein
MENSYFNGQKIIFGIFSVECISIMQIHPQSRLKKQLKDQKMNKTNIQANH